MCGIAGIVRRDGKAVSRDLVLNMMDRLCHRGPDGYGVLLTNEMGSDYSLTVGDATGREVTSVARDATPLSIGFGNRRLSIIDLPGGAQPLANEDNTVWLVFNGEIYNYLELRQELVRRGHRFRTQSDTEVIVHSYEEWGSECVHYFNGMFAFAVWDGQSRRLFLARDRLGIKPLYYMSDDNTFLFGSEIKALVSQAEQCVQHNPPAIAQYWHQGYIADGHTFFRRVQALLPGHYLLLERGQQPAIQRYWSLPNNIQPIGVEDAVIQLGKLLHDAVRLQLRSDVEVGAHLSGGTDSSLVVSLASRQLNRQLKTFTGCWVPGTVEDERSYARLVSEHCNTDHHEIVIADMDPVQTLRKMMWYLDEPVAGPGVIPQYWVSELCSRYVKVVLGGQGGDELFGGYRAFVPAFLLAKLQQAVRSPGWHTTKAATSAMIAVLQLVKPTEVSRALRRRLHGRRVAWLTPAYDALFHSLSAHSDSQPPDAGLSLLDREMRKTLQGYLPALLQIEDRTSMAVSLESRVPLLDHRLVEFAVSLPYELKFDGRQTKLLVRRLASDMLPPAILQRRDKVGFTAPHGFWYGDAMRRLVDDVLDPNAIKHRGVLRPEAASVLRHAYDSQDDSYLIYIWRAINIELWFQTFVDGMRVDD